MQTEEQAIEAGLLRPMVRLMVLGSVCYVASVAASVIKALDGSLFIDFMRFPIFDSFFLPWSLLHLPVMGFCLVVSVMDRSTTLKTNILGGSANFVYYALAEFNPRIGTAGGLALYALFVGTVIYFVYLRGSPEQTIPSK